MLKDPLVVTARESLGNLNTEKVVVLNGDLGPINAEQEYELCSFIKHGGGLVCLGDAVEAYREYPLLGEVLGPVHGICVQRSEIIARVTTGDHYLTRRMDSSFTVYEGVYLLDIVPTDAVILWQASWQYAKYTVAYAREFGQGRVFCTTLGSNQQTQNLSIFQQLLFRGIRFAAGVETQEQTKRVAMIGYGAIGFEHGTAINNVAGLEYALVCDRNEDRLAIARQSFPGINTCTELREIEEDPNIDVVIVSTPPDTHAAISKQMLLAGKHVVSEKPFCLTTAESDELIQLAQDNQRALTVYQCRRWDPDFLAIQEVLKRETIGDVFHIETFIGGYAHPCDYWHSHEPISGGVFYDWGSHYLDWILQLVPDTVVSVRGVEHKRVWHDITNADHSSVYLRFAGGQEAEFMHSDIAAAMKPKWYILGTQGAIVGYWRQETVKTRRWSGDLVEERLAPSEALPDLFVYTREMSGAIHEQHLMLSEAPLYAFHRNLANHLHGGEPLVVPPEQSRRNIAVMEAAKRSAECGGEVIALEC